MKLVEISARDIKTWDDRWIDVQQTADGTLVVRDENRYGYVLFPAEIAEDRESDVVTRAQWEAERARIAANQQATQEAREIAQGSGKTFDNADAMIAEIEKELVDIACGKRSKEDQELWDKVAVAYFGSGCGNDPHDIAIDAALCADAFMAEREKRMKG